MNFNKLLGVSHPTNGTAVGADLSRLYLSPRQDAADLLAKRKLKDTPDEFVHLHYGPTMPIYPHHSSTLIQMTWNRPWKRKSVVY